MWDADDAGDHHQPARPLRRGDRHPRRRPRPALGLLRLGGDEPEPRAREDHRRPARRRRADHAARLLRRRARAARRPARELGEARLQRGGVPRRGRPVGAGRREGPLGAGDDLVAADLRGQRHGRRLPGRRLQDGDPGAGDGEDLLPPRLRPGPAQGARGLPRARQRPHPRRTARSSSTSTAPARAVAFDTSGAGLPEDARRRSPTSGARRRPSSAAAARSR